MRIREVRSVLAALALVASLAPGAGTVASAASSASPLLTMGPQAIPVAVAGPNYGLFTCQVVGLNPTHTCYDPYQMRHAYGIDNLINAGFNGKGKTIIIVDAFQSPNIAAQLNFYDTFYGLPGLNGLGNPADPSLGTFTQVAPDGLTPFVTGDPNMTGWAEEISLDVLWAHAIAPGANIVLDLARSNEDADILSATKYAVDHNLGDIVSQSFGENESCVDSTLLKAQHQLFAAATLKHITLFASSGDDGAAQATCDGLSYVQAASSPASDPLVTAVGGTELSAARYCLTALGCDPTANPAPGTYQGEVAWNEFDSNIGTGGGYSVLYKAPFFQRLATRGGRQRGVPDVAYSAAVYHGALTYLDIPGIPAGIYLFGGTSAGSPQWAAIAAIADQKAGRRLGFINAALYLYSLFPNLYSTLFHDVTTGNNSVVVFDSLNNPVTVTGFNAGTGWDATTGLGSPRADNLVNFLTRFTSWSDGNQAVQSTDPNLNGHSGHHQVGPH
jgi:subtilase family serine protease